jgi:hypothetical protein
VTIIAGFRCDEGIVIALIHRKRLIKPQSAALPNSDTNRATPAMDANFILAISELHFAAQAMGR